MKKYKNKYYLHFDTKKKFNNVINYISDPDKIKAHSFFPFIHFEIKFKKYVLKNKHIKNEKKEIIREKKHKIRCIKYAAHIDRFIYQYYGDLLNNQYNKHAKKIGINKAITAYRNNFKGKNNIHFAKEVFEFIVKQDKAFIFLGDFTNFFDNLEHAYLKKQLLILLEQKSLPDHHYAIYKNITKYSYIELSDIEKYYSKTSKELIQEGKVKYFGTKDFQKIKRLYLKRNKNNYGIPQGSSISSVYSNIYMMDFDKKLNNFVTSNKGMYRRYCDDFIIIIPIQNKNEVKKYKNYIFNITKEVPRLDLNPEKTESYIYNKQNTKKIISIDNNNRFLFNYLGFSFDGLTIRIRDKSLFKYYSRAYKKARTVLRHKLIDSDKEKIIRRKLFNLYTYIGDKKFQKKKHGNFITYARRAHEIFSKSKLLNSEINNQVKRHWSKISNKLKVE
ncbi:reverse transcriptase domain-containing protein [Neobacillus thermocopriae]|uniref:reverse transcriptase domain-containing protein n=1 Tax=Neobacillus thermocopriae TaxID=1215031 RepID=UPI00376FF12A